MRLRFQGAAVAVSVLASFAVLSLATVPGCSSSRSHSSVASSVGPQGGVVAGVSSLSGFSVTFPAGALSTDTAITITDGNDIPAIRALLVSPAYHVDAGGASFSMPVTVTIPYDPQILYGSFPGADESQLYVLQREDATGSIAWRSPSSIDTVNHLVSVAVTSFSTFQAATAEPARYAYVTNYTSNTISIFALNNGTGRPRPRGYIYLGSTTDGPTPIVVDPTNTFIFAANYSANTALAWELDANGFLTPFGGSIATGSGPVGIAVDPQLTYGYVANLNGNSVSAYGPIGSGVITLINTYATGTYPEAVIMHPTGLNGTNYVYVPNYGSNNVSVFSASESNGTLTPIQTIALTSPASGPIAAVIEPSGNYAYFADWTSGSISTYKIAQSGSTQGELTFLQNTTAGTSSVQNPIGLTTDIYGSFVVSANFGSNTVSSFTIAATGTLSLTPTSTANAGSGPNAVQHDPAGNYVYVVNQGSNEILSFALTKAGQTGAGTLTPGDKVRTQDGPTTVSVNSGANAVAYTSKYCYVVSNASAKTIVDQFSIDTGANAGELATNGTGPNPGTDPVSIAIDPTETYVYVANQTATTIAGYTISGAGALTANGTTAAPAGGGNLTSIATEPSGRYVFALNQTKNSIYTYAIGATGGLTLSSTLTGVGVTPVSLVVDPSGRFVYVMDAGPSSTHAISVDAYAVNVASGALTSIGNYTTGGNYEELFTQPALGQMAVDSTGRYLYVPNVASNSISAFAIDNTAGSLTTVPGSPFAGNALDEPIAIAANPWLDVIYVANAASTGPISVYSITPSSGALGAVTTLSLGNASEPVALTTDLNGGCLYVACYGNATVAEYGLNATSGSPTTLNTPTITTGTGTTPIAILVAGTIQ
jgi:6-phosphogluconolactonase (cycloisomerase 2 family)